MTQKRALKFLVAAMCTAAISPIMAQSNLEPPAGQQVVLTVKGEGVQIYACKNVAGTTQWVFQAPEAKLFDVAGKEIGTHGAGPFWKSADGSLVKGQLVASNKAPEAGDIPWLLLKSSSHEGDGVLSKVEYIRRSETHGGAAPSSGCDSGHLDTTARSAYSATYTFYAAKP
jgi:hypothetical protein